MMLIDAVWPTMNVLPDTVVGSQLTGAPGAVGTYNVTPSQTLSSETLYAGVRRDDAETEWVVQLDLHGPASGDNTRVVETLFRSEYATSAFADTGYTVVPLYCDDPREMPFINQEQQYEWRWTIDCHFQLTQVVGTPQQFATDIVVTPVEAATEYTGPNP